MKREKKLYEKIDYTLVERCAKKALKGKKGLEASEFRRNLDKKVLEIYFNLKMCAYHEMEIEWQHLIKVNTNGKVRIISKTSLEWRVVMHVLLELGRPKYLQYRADCSYNCLEGYGITAKDKNKSLLHQVKRSMYDAKIWGYVQIDIKHCYQTTNCKILRKRHRELYGDKRYTDLLAKTCSCNEELPIGTPQSPTDHHLMLIKFDHYVLEHLPIVDYQRYADDMRFSVLSLEDAHEVVRRACNYLYYELRYEAKQNIKIYPVRVKCDMCGFVVHKTEQDRFHNNKGFTRLRRSTTIRLKRAKQESSKSSYRGLVKQADAKKLLNKYYGMDYSEVLKDLKINRRWDAEDIDIKILAEKKFDIIDFEARAPDKEGGKFYIKMMVKFPSYDKEGKPCFEIRRCKGCIEDLAKSMYQLQNKLHKLAEIHGTTYEAELAKVLPIEGAYVEKNYGFVFGGSCENKRFVYK